MSKPKLSWFAAAGAVLLVGFPFWFVVVTAGKDSQSSRLLSAAPPANWHLLENLGTVVRDGQAARGFLNSCLVTAPAIVLTLLLGAAAAWIFARTTNKLVGALYYVAISGILLPPAVVSSVSVLRVLGLDGTRTGLVLFYFGMYFSLSVFLMTGFVKSIPMEIEDAARIDGCSTLRMFGSIILPMLRPILWTTGIFLMLQIWNDFFYAFFLLRGETRHTLPLGLYAFASAQQHELNWNLIFADVLLVSAPILAVFLIGQRGIVRGLMAGIGK